MAGDQHDHEPEHALPEVQPEAWALLVEALEPTALVAGVRERVLAQLQGPERWAPFAGDVAQAFGVELADVRDALARSRDPQAWHPGFWPGSRLLITPPLVRKQTVIASLPAGTRIPRHRHAGRELTYVLDGVLVENDGARHEAGRLLDMAPGSEHDVSVPEGDECLVVFSVPRG